MEFNFGEVQRQVGNQLSGVGNFALRSIERMRGDWGLRNAEKAKHENEQTIIDLRDQLNGIVERHPIVQVTTEQQSISS